MRKKSIAGSGDKLPSQQPPKKQLLKKKAEEYIRESGNIEDLPNPAESKAAERVIRKTRKK